MKILKWGIPFLLLTFLCTGCMGSFCANCEMPIINDTTIVKAVPPAPAPVVKKVVKPAPVPVPAPVVKPAPAPVPVVKKADLLFLHVTARVLFPYNSSELTGKAESELDKVIAYMKANPEEIVKLTGNTCDIGSDSDNYALGQRRAKSAKAYVVAGGIDENRVLTGSMGENAPVASNATNAGKIQNRNICIKYGE